jgi:hypothetical protein
MRGQIIGRSKKWNVLATCKTLIAHVELDVNASLPMRDPAVSHFYPG